MKKLRRQIDAALGRHAAAKALVKRSRTGVAEAEDLLFDTEEAASLIRGVAQAVQTAAHGRISGVVSKCLEMVFDEPYEFQVLFEQKRGRTEARLVFIRDGAEISPLDSSGGGVVDVAAFALRLSCLMLAKPKRRRLVILDEPFKFVSAEYRGRVRGMLEALADDLGMQIVMVTHVAELECGTIVRIGD